MQLIITSSTELKELTGSFYANNDFSKISIDIELVSEEIASLIGQDIFDLALGEYETPEADQDELIEQTELVKHVQLPVAILAAYHFYQNNIVSHEDGGRKVKIDSENEKMAWEWMLDRDDQAQLRRGQRAIDRLIAFLDKSNIEAWTNGEQKKAARKLFIPSSKVFNEFFPIDNSSRFYYLVRPFIHDIQIKKIKPLLGDDYASLLSAFQNGTISPDQEDLLHLVQSAMALKTIETSIKRLSVQLLPDGVIQGFLSSSQSRHSANVAPEESIKKYLVRLGSETEQALDEVRRYRNRNTDKALDPVLLPKNDPCNKYFRT